MMLINNDSEAVRQRCSAKKGALKNFAKSTGEHLCQNLFFHIVVGTSGGWFCKVRA